MMILKISLQILSGLAAVMIAVLDYSWHDKRTSKFKKLRYWLYLVLFTLLFLSVSLTILDDHEKKRESAELKQEIGELTRKNEASPQQAAGYHKEGHYL